MRVDEFDFELPEHLIALRPAEPRDSARLLRVVPGHTPSDHKVRDLPQFLKPGDALVFNDTKVIPAQLEGRRMRDGIGAGISVTLHMREADDRWRAFARGAKKIRPGDRISFGGEGNVCLTGSLDATVAEKGEGGEIVLRFDLSGPVLDEAIHAVGQVPIPPYIALRRPEDHRDREDYQTMYARVEGAVAAPTAGLHFTPDLMEAIDAAGAARHFVTLHVGAGTFLPVKSELVEDHVMHAEYGEISEAVADSLNEVRRQGGRIICVGTTSLRLLESAVGDDGEFAAWQGSTDIFITPGYRFRAADMLFTNFHLPRSTLLMLVSAFSGVDTIRLAYSHAIEQGYRFYSYGDACLLYPDR